MMTVMITLNMPSSLEVNWQPHSDFSLLIIIFSLSSLADFWFRRRLEGAGVGAGAGVT